MFRVEKVKIYAIEITLNYSAGCVRFSMRAHVNALVNGSLRANVCEADVDGEMAARKNFDVQTEGLL